MQYWNSLQWRRNEHDGVSNHQPHDCLLNCLFRHRSKKTSKLPITGLCEGNSPVTGKCFHFMTSLWFLRWCMKGAYLIVNCNMMWYIIDQLTPFQYAYFQYSMCKKWDIECCYLTPPALKLGPIPVIWWWSLLKLRSSGFFYRFVIMYTLKRTELLNSTLLTLYARGPS